VIALTRVPQVEVGLVEVVVVEVEETTVVEAVKNATSVAKLDTSPVIALREVLEGMVAVEEDIRAVEVATVGDMEEAVVAVAVGVKLATLVVAMAICRETAPKGKSATTAARLVI